MLGEGGKVTSGPTDRGTGRGTAQCCGISAAGSACLTRAHLTACLFHEKEKKPSDYMDGMHFLRVATKLFRYVPKDMFLRYQRRKKKIYMFSNSISPTVIY